MKCEKFQGITTEEACLAQQKARKILCQNCDQRQGAEESKTPVKAKRKYNRKTQIPKTTPPIEPKPHPLKLTVDFGEYPELYEFVMRGPKEYLRTPENMILYGVALLLKEAQ